MLRARFPDADAGGAPGRALKYAPGEWVVRRRVSFAIRSARYSAIALAIAAAPRSTLSMARSSQAMYSSRFICAILRPPGRLQGGVSRGPHRTRKAETDAGVAVLEVRADRAEPEPLSRLPGVEQIGRAHV